MCTYMHIHIHMCIHIYIYNVYTCIYICKANLPVRPMTDRPYTCICVYICMYMYIYVYIQKHDCFVTCCCVLRAVKENRPHVPGRTQVRPAQLAKQACPSARPLSVHKHIYTHMYIYCIHMHIHTQSKPARPPDDRPTVHMYMCMYMYIHIHICVHI